MLTRIICLLIGYVFGLIQWGYIVGRMKGIDIREHGSGNSGATNTLRVLGTKYGITVLLLDAGKCILAILLTYCLFGKAAPEMALVYKFYTALGVIIGHDFPFYLNFKGGKGIAATAGLIITFGPFAVIINLLLFAVAYLSTHFVSLGSLVIYGAFFIEMIIAGQCGYFDGSGITQAGLIEVYILTFLMTVMAYVRHRKNIVRLYKHEESKVYLFKKKDK